MSAPARRFEPDLSAGASLRLDVLRAFLLVQVVLGHLAMIDLPAIPTLAHFPVSFQLFVWAYRATTRLGPQSAYLFVLLSGFFVGGALLRARTRGMPVDADAFIGRRIRRLAPGLAVSLILSAGFDFAGIYCFGAGDIYRSQQYDFVAAFDLPHFLGNLICLQPTFVGAFGSNGPLWTLGYIVQFYFAGYFMLRLMAARGWLGILIVAAILALAASARAEWAALCGLWLLGAALRTARPLARFAVPALGLGGLLLLAANRTPPLISIGLSGLAGVALVQGLRGFDWTPSSRLARRARALAAAGYEIYAVHYPAAFFVFATIFGARAASISQFLVFVALAVSAVAASAVAARSLSTWSARWEPKEA